MDICLRVLRQDGRFSNRILKMIEIETTQSTRFQPPGIAVYVKDYYIGFIPIVAGVIGKFTQHDHEPEAGIEIWDLPIIHMLVKSRITGQNPIYSSPSLTINGKTDNLLIHDATVNEWNMCYLASYSADMDIEIYSLSRRSMDVIMSLQRGSVKCRELSVFSKNFEVKSLDKLLGLINIFSPLTFEFDDMLSFVFDVIKDNRFVTIITQEQLSEFDLLYCLNGCMIDKSLIFMRYDNGKIVRLDTMETFTHADVINFAKSRFGK